MKTKTEAKIQQEIVQHYRFNYYKKGLIFSVPNERAGGYLAMKGPLLTGLLSGVSDLIVVEETRVLFVEVKTAIGRQSEKQKKFENNIKSLGYKYHLVRSLEDFIKIIS